ncbi:hypothetical protein FQR65_LT17979 [Abscondita terminalis]|nr:hypothetical protein FQR65_LT17979 [Abscondita terminalis]
MGGLRKKLPVTYFTMLIGTIAIAGIPPLSGFFSKDEILAFAFAENKLLWTIGFIAALCTAFYMFRLLYLTFFGTFRGTEEQKHHLHESPFSMTLPLIILAVLAAVGGLMNIPEALGGGHKLANFLAPVFADSQSIKGTFHIDHQTEYILMAVSALAAVIMAVVAYGRYVKRGYVPKSDALEDSGLHKLSYHKLYVDELYDSVIVKPLNTFSRFLYKVIDRSGIDGIVNGIGNLFVSSGKGIRQLQNGHVGFYIFMMVVAVMTNLFILLLLPLISAGVLAFVKNSQPAKIIALTLSLLQLAFTIPFLCQFVPDASVQFEQNYSWIESLGIHFHIGLDGISLPLVLLTNALMPLIVLSTFSKTYKGNLYALVAFMQAGLVLVFTALDAFYILM